MYEDPKSVEGYHAHVYFRTPEERETALALHEHLGDAFAEVRVGRLAHIRAQCSRWRCHPMRSRG